MSWKIAGNNDLKQKGGHSQDKKDDYLAASSWRGRAAELTEVCTAYCWEGQHRETKDDCVAALPWEGVVPWN